MRLKKKTSPGEDRLLVEFFEMEDNKSLYNNYLKNPSKDKKIILDDRFKKHVYLTRCVAYLIKSIHFYSQKYDYAVRNNSKKYPLILDSPVDEAYTLIEKLSTSIQENTEYSSRLEEYISDPDLFNRLELLTERQKEILYLKYIKELKDNEIAKLLNISQQAINKSKNKALTQLKKGVAKNGRGY